MCWTCFVLFLVWIGTISHIMLIQTNKRKYPFSNEAVITSPDQFSVWVLNSSQTFSKIMRSSFFYLFSVPKIVLLILTEVLLFCTFYFYVTNWYQLFILFLCCKKLPLCLLICVVDMNGQNILHCVPLTITERVNVTDLLSYRLLK